MADEGFIDVRFVGGPHDGREDLLLDEGFANRLTVGAHFMGSAVADGRVEQWLVVVTFPAGRRRLAPETQDGRNPPGRVG